MHAANRDKILLAFVIGAVAFWWLAGYGAYKAYSPVPFWDMWDGYLAFFVNAETGGWRVWWGQHNEHRIFLARLLFWIDLAWFGGMGWFLICANLLLFAMVGWLFWRAWQENSEGQNEFVGFFLVAWSISWIQNENITWGFQSQFILAQLLPLAAFLQLHRFAASNGANQGSFLWACSLGVLSIGSMANGVLALPLMTLYALLIRLDRTRTAILAILSFVSLTIYFIDYQAPQHHGSLLRAMVDDPLGIAEYILLYLGNPFYALVGGGKLGFLAAHFAGAFIVLGSCAHVWFALRAKQRPTMQLALLMFILYISLTALGTAGGRLIFGVQQALSSRYATPSLMAWAAFLVLMAPRFNYWSSENRWKLWAPFIALLLLITPAQLMALSSRDNILFERSIAALALELKIQDQAQISRLYPSAEEALSLANIPSERNISIFGIYPFKDAHKKIGTKIANLGDQRQCLGRIEFFREIEKDSRYLQVHGWIFDREGRSSPKALQIVGSEGKIIGFALTGRERPDVAAQVHLAAFRSGFTGYFLADRARETITLTDPESGCRISVELFK